jgi:F0F1-type ATP synthase membrane subunit b/b'
VVDEIEKQAEAETAEEVEKINMQIAGFQGELQSIVSSAKEGQEEVIGSSIVQKKKELELKILQAQRQLRQVKMTRRERIEQLGNRLRQANMLGAPAVILIIAIVLGLRRGMRKRHYISHASDA